MDITYYKQYEPIFGVWHITRQLGEGAYGKVFEMEREDFGVTYKAALKAITIPATQSELRAVRSEGMDEESVRTYFGGFVQKLAREFALMSKLKGNSNIVSYENHQVIEHKDGIGWDILIQMELLTPLDDYIRQKKALSRQEIIQLGIDLCKALELCQKYNIIHRDVKPENILVSENGDFKLGDFGVARTVEKTMSGLSKQGSFPYMAPEVEKGEAYGSTVDIYSLGLVLYRLLNGNRLPFLPPAPAPIKYADREDALAKRFNGVPLPPPSHADGRLAEIVLKACAFAPKDRYSSPAQMRQELEAILYNREEARYIYPEGDEVPQASVHDVPDEGTISDFGDPPQEEDTGTISDFGSPPPEEDAGTISDFGEAPMKDGGKTLSDFAKPPKKNGGKSKGKSKKEKLQEIVAKMLPACADVSIGMYTTTAATADDFTEKEKKYIQFAFNKVPRTGRGDVLGYCGIIYQANGTYGVILTTTGIYFPKSGLRNFGYRQYIHLPYTQIQQMRLCEKLTYQSIEFTLQDGTVVKMTLPANYFIHRTNLCKLIQSIGQSLGNFIRFE